MNKKKNHDEWWCGGVNSDVCNYNDDDATNSTRYTQYNQPTK